MYTNIQTILVVHALACLENFSERIPLFCSPPTFLTMHLARKRLILGNIGCLLLLRQTIKTCQETLFDWLIIQSLVWVTRKDFLVHSQSHSLDRQQKGQNFLKRNLVSDLFHGYKDLAGQSS